MAWIESHQDLGQHPKTFALAQKLDISMPEAVGYLTLLWHFALKFAWRDGDLAKFASAAIARSIFWPHDADLLIAALQETGWLDGLKIHDWLDYAGKIVKDRLYNEERRNTPLNAVPHRKIGATNPTVPDLTNLTNQLTPAAGVAAARVFDFEILWGQYPRRIGRKAALKHFQSSVKTENDWSAIQRALQSYLGHIKKTNVEPQFIQHGSTWFNNWRDWTNYGGDHGTNDRKSTSGISDIFEQARQIKRTSELRKVTPPREILAGLRNSELGTGKHAIAADQKPGTNGIEPSRQPLEKI